MKKLIFSSEKHQATLLSYCAAMKIISEAKLSIYHKFLMAQRITTHLRLLRQLKFLTASKTLTVLDYPKRVAVFVFIDNILFFRTKSRKGSPWSVL